MCRVTFDFKRRSKHDSIRKFKGKNFWVGFEITGICGFNCIYCATASSSDVSSFYDVERVDWICSHLCRLSESIQISIVGGEPLRHPDFAGVLKILNDYGFILHLSTNSFLLNDIVVNKLLRSNVTQIETNIDHINPKKHDIIRGMPGSYDRTVASIETLVDSGIDVLVATVLCKHNSEVIPQIFSLANDLECSSYRLWDIVPSERAIYPLSNIVSNNKFRQISHSILTKAEDLEVSEMRSIDPTLFMKMNARKYNFKMRLLGCPVRRGNCHFNIGYDDRIHLCGGCRHRDFLPLSELPRVNMFLERKHKELIEESKEICGNCPFFSQCKGGCYTRTRYFGYDYRCPTLVNKFS